MRSPRTGLWLAIAALSVLACGRAGAEEAPLLDGPTGTADGVELPADLAVAEMAAAVQAVCTGPWALHRFQVLKSANLGDVIQPMQRSRFRARARLTRRFVRAIETLSFPATASVAGEQALVVTVVAEPGKVVEVFGYVTSRPFEAGWRHEVHVDGEPLALAGSPDDPPQGMRLLVQGSAEEAEFREGMKRAREAAARRLELLSAAHAAQREATEARRAAVQAEAESLAKASLELGDRHAAAGAAALERDDLERAAVLFRNSRAVYEEARDSARATGSARAKARAAEAGARSAEAGALAAGGERWASAALANARDVLNQGAAQLAQGEFAPAAVTLAKATEALQAVGTEVLAAKEAHGAARLEAAGQHVLQGQVVEAQSALREVQTLVGPASPTQPRLRQLLRCVPHSWLEDALARVRRDGRRGLEKPVVVGLLGSLSRAGHRAGYDALLGQLAPVTDLPASLLAGVAAAAARVGDAVTWEQAWKQLESVKDQDGGRTWRGWVQAALGREDELAAVLAGWKPRRFSVHGGGRPVDNPKVIDAADRLDFTTSVGLVLATQGRAGAARAYVAHAQAALAVVRSQEQAEHTVSRERLELDPMIVRLARLHLELGDTAAFRRLEGDEAAAVQRGVHAGEFILTLAGRGRVTSRPRLGEDHWWILRALAREGQLSLLESWRNQSDGAGTAVLIDTAVADGLSAGFFPHVLEILAEQLSSGALDAPEPPGRTGEPGAPAAAPGGEPSDARRLEGATAWLDEAELLLLGGRAGYAQESWSRAAHAAATLGDFARYRRALFQSMSGPSRADEAGAFRAAASHKAGDTQLMDRLDAALLVQPGSFSSDEHKWAVVALGMQDDFAAADRFLAHLATLTYRQKSGIMALPFERVRLDAERAASLARKGARAGGLDLLRRTEAAVALLPAEWLTDGLALCAGAALELGDRPRFDGLVAKAEGLLGTEPTRHEQRSRRVESTAPSIAACQSIGALVFDRQAPERVLQLRNSPSEWDLHTHETAAYYLARQRRLTELRAWYPTLEDASLRAWVSLGAVRGLLSAPWADGQ